VSATSHFRRRLLLGGGAALLSLPLNAAERLLTPRQSAGPFYPVTPPLDDDNDLTYVTGQPGRAEGQISDLSGRVLDRNGHPLSGLRVEIWQCDANGRYRHPGDRQPVPKDPSFQGFGHTHTDAKGQYRFRTIRPVPYPGRTPHIHAAIFPEGESPFVTQIYVAGEAQNAEDFLFRRIPVELRPLLLAEFAPATEAGIDLAAHFDFVLAAPLADRPA